MDRLALACYLMAGGFAFLAGFLIWVRRVAIAYHEARGELRDEQ